MMPNTMEMMAPISMSADCDLVLVCVSCRR
jgi:hypothetical protein